MMEIAYAIHIFFFFFFFLGPAQSHGNSYIFYDVANLYDFVWPHSYKFILILHNSYDFARMNYT